MEKQSEEYDSPWKEIIEQYFQNFIEFFFPKAYADIDWSKGYEFLDKELRKICKDVEIGRKYVDKLVKVWLKSGKDMWVNIHADIRKNWKPGSFVKEQWGCKVTFEFPVNG